jgi:hypothetical protein
MVTLIGAAMLREGASEDHPLADKLARIAWTVLAHGRNFEARKIDDAAPRFHLIAERERTGISGPMPTGTTHEMRSNTMR